MSLNEFLWSAVFVIVFICSLAVTIYLVGSAKPQAQPWRFLVAAVIVIFLGWGFQIMEKWRAEKAPEPLPMLESIAELVNLTCGAFAGALASIAIANRAKFDHDKEVSKIKSQWYQVKTQEEHFLARLKPLSQHLKESARSADPAAAPLVSDAIGRVDDSADRRRKKRLKFEKKAKMLGVSLEQVQLEYDKEKFELMQALDKVVQEESMCLSQLRILYDMMESSVKLADTVKANAILLRLHETYREVEGCSVKRRMITERAKILAIQFD